MLYHRKQLEVDAIKLEQPFEINGKTGQPGDYLITLPGGNLSIMRGRVFEKNFELAESAQAPDLAEDKPVPQEVFEKKSQMICIGCSQEVDRKMFEPKTGLCLDCLHSMAECQTCGEKVKNHDIIGTRCRKCLGRPVL